MRYVFLVQPIIGKPDHGASTISFVSDQHEPLRTPGWITVNRFSSSGDWERCVGHILRIDLRGEGRVHLKALLGRESVTCVATVKHFVARCGRVPELHCDNATSFVEADYELRKPRKQLERQFQSHCYCSGNAICTLRRHMRGSD